MKDLVPYSTSEINAITDVNKLADIYRQAEALVRMIVDDWETQNQIIKRRNHALRRIGQIRAEIGNSPSGKSMSMDEFDKSLGLSKRDVQKAVSLAAMSLVDFEARETTTGRILFDGTRYGLTLQRDADERAEGRAAREAARKEERREHFGSGPKPRSVMPDTLAPTPEPTPGPAIYPRDDIIDVTPVEVVDNDPTGDTASYFLAAVRNAHRNLTCPTKAEMDTLPTDARNQLFSMLDDLIGICEEAQGVLRG